MDQEWMYDIQSELESIIQENNLETYDFGICQNVNMVYDSTQGFIELEKLDSVMVAITINNYYVSNSIGF